MILFFILTAICLFFYHTIALGGKAVPSVRSFLFADLSAVPQKVPVHNEKNVERIFQTQGMSAIIDKKAFMEWTELYEIQKRI